MKLYRLCLISAIIATTGCDIVVPGGSIEFVFDFSNGAQGWSADFADLPADDQDVFDLRDGIEDLPSELDRDGTGYLLSGRNASDDLFMFISRRLTAADGIEPGQSYNVTFDINIASNAQSNCIGIGGPPGEAVFVKVGGASVAPDTVEDTDGFLRMNIDAGNQSNSGENATVVGNIANGVECSDTTDNAPLVIINRSIQHANPITADDSGQLWLLVGTDSGFEGTTSVYYLDISVQLTSVP